MVLPQARCFSRKFPLVSVVRPTETKGVAMGAVKSLTDDGLFIGQSPEFLKVLQDLATQADAAERQS